MNNSGMNNSGRFAGALLGMAGLAALCGPAAAQTSITLAMSAGVNQVPSLVALDQGYFADEGLEVRLMPVARGGVAVEAMASGSVEFAESAHTTFFSAVNSGLPLIAIGTATRGYFGKMIASNQHADLSSISDFKGKRIGTQVGTGMHMVVEMLIEQAGLSVDDFQITNIRVVDMPAAMASGGAFDAVIGWEPGMQRIVQSGNGVEVMGAPDFEREAQITYPFVISARREYVEANPEIVQGVLNAYARAHAFVRDNPEAAVDIYHAALEETGAELDRETAEFMMFDTERFGGSVMITSADRVDWEGTRDFLIRTRPDFANLPEIDAMMTNSFAEQADELLSN